MIYKTLWQGIATGFVILYAYEQWVKVQDSQFHPEPWSVYASARTSRVHVSNLWVLGASPFSSPGLLLGLNVCAKCHVIDWYTI